ncbi:MAG: hypothetical protein IJ127_18500 [Afipia sp.]|nr:hypothetical protein [Afipia sp.]MBS4002384.1 hypothetical protein [Afipia sp.]WIG53558.1 MAG: hypothetical protein OJF48_004478 [Afipia sp.]
MLFHLTHAERLDRAADRLQSTDVVTAALVSEIIAECCDRLPVSGQGRAAAHLRELIEAGAWTDAVVMLMETELPRWRLRRLVYDEGEWHCALSLQRDLPDWLDQAVETSHSELPLALLKAFVEAKRRDGETAEDARRATGLGVSPQQPSVSCENFT